MKPVQSNFVSHRFTGEATPGNSLIYRILKMDNSLFVYIGKRDDQKFLGLGLGITVNKESLSTSIVESSDSCELAQKLSKRLAKPVFISCNESLSQFVKPLIEQRIIEEITIHPEYF